MNRMNYIWIAIAILLIVFVSTNVQKEGFQGKCNRSCPVHSTHFDPPYPHSFHFVYKDNERNRIYECTKCRCQTKNTDNYPTTFSF
jgi:hypothetical protein